MALKGHVTKWASTDYCPANLLCVRLAGQLPDSEQWCWLWLFICAGPQWQCRCIIIKRPKVTHLQLMGENDNWRRRPAQVIGSTCDFNDECRPAITPNRLIASGLSLCGLPLSALPLLFECWKFSCHYVSVNHDQSYAGSPSCSPFSLFLTACLGHIITVL